MLYCTVVKKWKGYLKEAKILQRWRCFRILLLTTWATKIWSPFRRFVRASIFKRIELQPPSRGFGVARSRSIPVYASSSPLMKEDILISKESFTKLLRNTKDLLSGSCHMWEFSSACLILCVTVYTRIQCLTFLANYPCILRLLSKRGYWSARIRTPTRLLWVVDQCLTCTIPRRPIWKCSRLCFLKTQTLKYFTVYARMSARALYFKIGLRWSTEWFWKLNWNDGLPTCLNLF